MASSWPVRSATSFSSRDRRSVISLRTGRRARTGRATIELVNPEIADRPPGVLAQVARERVVAVLKRRDVPAGAVGRRGRHTTAPRDSGRTPAPSTPGRRRTARAMRANNARGRPDRMVVPAERAVDDGKSAGLEVRPISLRPAGAVDVRQYIGGQHEVEGLVRDGVPAVGDVSGDGVRDVGGFGSQVLIGEPRFRKRLDRRPGQLLCTDSSTRPDGRAGLGSAPSGPWWCPSCRSPRIADSRPRWAAGICFP